MLFELPFQIRSIIWEMTERDRMKYNVLQEMSTRYQYSNVIREMNKVGEQIEKVNRFSFVTSSRLFVIPRRSKFILPSHKRHLRHVDID